MIDDSLYIRLVTRVGMGTQVRSPGADGINISILRTKIFRFGTNVQCYALEGIAWVCRSCETLTLPSHYAARLVLGRLETVSDIRYNKRQPIHWSLANSGRDSTDVSPFLDLDTNTHTQSRKP